MRRTAGSGPWWLLGVARGDEGERFVCGQDADALEGDKIEQVPIASDDELGGGAECAGEHLIVSVPAPTGWRRSLAIGMRLVHEAPEERELGA